jgi:hypothetical protein
VGAHAEESGFQLFSQNWAALFFALVTMARAFRATLAQPDSGLCREPEGGLRTNQTASALQSACTEHPPECKPCTSSAMSEISLDLDREPVAGSTGDRKS